jgi:hypothetical protein
MTINTTKDPRPETKSVVASELPITSKTQPGLGVPHASSEPGLESRIKVRRAELAAKLGELKKDLRLEATETRDRLKAKLSELSHLLKWGVVDGWTTVGGTVKQRLEQWLGDTERQRPTQDHDGPARTE